MAEGTDSNGSRERPGPRWPSAPSWKSGEDPEAVVLLIEDNPADALLAAEMLRRAGRREIRVEVTTRLEEGLRTIGERDPDVLLLGLPLQDVPGLGALASVREAAPSTPVVVLSALAADDVIERAARMGADDYLVKGRFDGDSLARAIRYALQRRRAAARLRESEERYRRLTEHVPDIIFRCRRGPPPVCEYVSPAATAITGYTAAELSADPCLLFGLIEAEDRVRLEALLAGDVATGEPVTVRWKHRSGEPRWMEIRGSALRDAPGRAVFEGIARDVTERRHAEEQLRLHAAALKAVANAVVITGIDGTILWVNPAFTELTGFTAEEAVGRNPRILRSGIHGSSLYDELWRTILGGQPWHGRLVNRRKDGTLFHEETTIAPFSSEAGTITRFVAVKQDVTARVRAEQALLESEQRYRLLFDGALEGMFQSDAGGRFLTVNPAFARILGYESPEELISSVKDIGAQLYAAPERRADYLAELRQRGFVSGFEAQFRRKDGTLAWLRVNTNAIRDERGELVRLDGMVEDVTERRHAVAALRAQEERYRVLFEDSPVPMWAYDPETLAIVAANEAAASQYGYSKDELTSMDLTQLRRPEDAEKIRLAVAATPPGPQAAGIWKHRRKDGTLLDVDVHLNDVVLGGRRLRLAVLHDVTQQKSLEEEYRQAQKMEAIGRLAGGVAHDFNNLLTVINGYTELLVDQLAGNESVQGRLAEIARAGERASDLTRQLLAFSRKQVVAPRVLDLNKVVLETEKMLRRLIGEDIQLTASLAPDLGCVLADRGQLEQVLMNLAVNARDAMPQGGTLGIETRNVEVDGGAARGPTQPGPGKYVLIAVSDNGCGMDEATRAHIFEPFFTTKAQGKGTGLGLSTVYGIVQQGGGTVSVDTSPGAGTRFDILLPRVDALPREERPRSGWMKAVSRRTVLVVEDEAAVRWLARSVLETVGYAVLEASSGPAALELLSSTQGRLDVLLTDMVMPGMSGPELAARVKDLRPDVKVVFMSGYSDEAITRHPLFEGREAFLEKPFRAETLTRKLREVCEGGASA